MLVERGTSWSSQGAVEHTMYGGDDGVGGDQMARRVWRVSARDDGWQVMRDGAARATKTFASKREAVKAARRLAGGNAPSRVVIHRADGTVQDHSDYGDDQGLSYAGVFEGPTDLGARSEKHLDEHFSQVDAGS